MTTRPATRSVRLAATTAILLAATAGTASAVEIEVLELGPFNTVEVAILAAPGLVPGSIKKRGLMLGWRQPGHDGGYVPALSLRPARRDVNGDGHPDATALFRLSDPDFQDLLHGDSVLVEVQGLQWDGGIARPFTAQATVLADSDPSSACTTVQNGLEATVGIRCIWTTADGSPYKPIQTQQLLGELNQELTNTDLQIAAASAVVIEAYAGVGHGGGNVAGTGCTAIGGDGGAPGYARTVVGADVLPDLFVYPGNSANDHGEGGAGTVLSSADLASLSEDDLRTTSAGDLASLGIMVIAGGGGGGGEGHVSDSRTECHHGGDGGGGGSAIAGTSGVVVGAGGDGTNHGTPGDGGKGSGGHGTPDGSGGIGGPGGAGYETGRSGVGGGELWNGWSTDDNSAYSATAWAFGAGAAGKSHAGAGGGGFGGGGAADDGDGQQHEGGGGGGGSFAMQATVDAADLDSSLIYGTPDQSGAMGQVVMTFELVTGSEQAR